MLLFSPRIPDYLVHFPDGFNVTLEDLYMAPSKLSLNEFGLYYVALYICSMYARYYPDMWIREIESSSTLSLAIEQFMDSAYTRLPLLALWEFTEWHYLRQAQ